MAECTNQAYDEGIYDFIITMQDMIDYGYESDCIQRLGANYVAAYYRPVPQDPPLNVTDYSYATIPRCFGLLDQAALENSGILRVRDQPGLGLTGQGVLFGIIDVDFDYTNPLFCYPDGSTRIERIWDQSGREGTPPKGFHYGTEYTREQIDEALFSDDPRERIPVSNGHGTFLAGVAAGSEDADQLFGGAAPGSSLVFVQLKPAKQYLRDFYFIPDDKPVFQENDIMAAVAYLDQLATELRMPLAICLALGTNMGNRDGTGPLALALDTVSRRRQRFVVVAAGNEAEKRHHFLGSLEQPREAERVEISVSSGVTGFAAELWSTAPQLYVVSVLSPTGERFVASPQGGSRLQYHFLFEDTWVSVDYRIEGIDNNNQLVYIRFDNPVQGIWTVLVQARNYVDGIYHIWLPMEEMLSGEVFFLRSNPDTTITSPSDTLLPIGVGGYNTENNSIYFASGRGYTVNSYIKPDFVAPAVDVYGPTGVERFGRMTGTSVAAAITAGAGALLLEWTGVRRNDISATTVTLKNYLIRGAGRDLSRSYPDRGYGWGRLDLYQAFENMRNV